MASELDVGMKCIKYMLFVSNFMFVMIGFLLISVGSTVNAINGDFSIFLHSHHYSPAALVVAVGVIIFLVALLGCVGAIRESTCLVNMFALLLSLILILEVAAAIAAYAMRGDLRERVEINMRSTIVRYNDDRHVRESWDFLQYRLQCCGVHNYTDWANIIQTNPNHLIPVPDSCLNRRNPKEINAISCLDRLSYVISESALLLGSGALCVAFVQLLGIIFSFMLAKAIRRVKSETERARQENRMRLYEQLNVGKEEKPTTTPVIYTSESKA